MKDAGGKLTGDKKMEWEGKAQKVKGDVEGAGREMTEGEPATDKPVEGEKGV
ncbi:MAG: CsbD family protein [Chloroflexi bacterium]|nr:MAG: CsbD family protein [Chloroflexota bacterium]TMD82644.1 MAG: CsbD family protein [Chloroflexota bacterium]